MPASIDISSPSILKARAGGLFFFSDGPKSHTGNTVETVVDALIIPGKSMGRNGILEVAAYWNHTENLNNKTHRIRFGAAGTAGTQFFGVTQSAAANDGGMRYLSIFNRNSESSQVSASTGSVDGLGNANATSFTSAIDTGVDQHLTFTSELAVGTDTATLLWWIVRLLNFID